MPTTNPLTAYPPGVVPNELIVPAGPRVGYLQLEQMRNQALHAQENELARQNELLRGAQEQLAVALARRPASPADPLQSAAAAAAAPAAVPLEQRADADLQKVVDKGQGVFGTVADLAKSVGAGIGGLVEGVGSLAALVGAAGPDNAVASFGRDVREGFQASQSESLRANRILRDRAVEMADTVGGEFAAAIINTVGSPELLFDLIAEMAPGVGVSGLAARGARAGALAMRTSERVARAAGITTAAATEALQQGASTAGETAREMAGWGDEVWGADPEFLQMVSSGLTPEQAKERMIRSAMQEVFAGTSALTLGVAAIPGAMAAEKWVAGIPRRAIDDKASLIRRIGQSGIGRTTIGAAGGGASEAIEEGGAQYLSNVAQQQVNPLVDPYRGVGAAAGIGAAGGTAVGGAGGFMQRAPAAVPQAPADAAGAVDAEAVPVDPELPPPGNTVPQEPAIPTGRDALRPSVRVALDTNVGNALRSVNNALARAKVRLYGRDGQPATDNEGRPLYMGVTAEEFWADPDGAVARLRDAGAVEQAALLETTAATVRQRVAEAEMRARIETAMDEETRGWLEPLAEGAREEVASRLRWDLKVLNEVLASDVVTESGDQPAAYRAQVVDAILRARDRRTEASDAAWAEIQSRIRAEADAREQRVEAENLRRSQATEFAWAQEQAAAQESALAQAQEQASVRREAEIARLAARQNELEQVFADEDAAQERIRQQMAAEAEYERRALLGEYGPAAQEEVLRLLEAEPEAMADAAAMAQEELDELRDSFTRGVSPETKRRRDALRRGDSDPKR